jgi:hypothetical protein
MNSSLYSILECLVTPLTGQNEGHQFADSQYAGTASMCAVIEAVAGLEQCGICCQPVSVLVTGSIQLALIRADWI